MNREELTMNSEQCGEWVFYTYIDFKVIADMWLLQGM